MKRPFPAFSIFQSTLPRGERLHSYQSRKVISVFQSTLPRGERLLIPPHLQLLVYFNPRSREWSDPGELAFPPAVYISIHSPARGATTNKELGNAIRKISIHAPARGATRKCNYNSKIHQNFNPRSREGSDCRLPHWHSLRQRFQSTLPRGERL